MHIKEIQMLLTIRKFVEEKQKEEEKMEKYFDIYFNVYLLLSNKLKMDNLVLKYDENKLNKFNDNYLLDNNQNKNYFEMELK